jgi:hypothetical protein
MRTSQLNIAASWPERYHKLAVKSPGLTPQVTHVTSFEAQTPIQNTLRIIELAPDVPDSSDRNRALSAAQGTMEPDA